MPNSTITSVDDINLRDFQGAVNQIAGIDNEITGQWLTDFLKQKFSLAPVVQVNESLAALRTGNNFTPTQFQQLMQAFENSLKQLEINANTADDIRRIIIILKGLHKRAEKNSKAWGAAFIDGGFKSKTGLTRLEIFSYGNRAADELQQKLQQFEAEAQQRAEAKSVAANNGEEEKVVVVVQAPEQKTARPEPQPLDLDQASALLKSDLQKVFQPGVIDWQQMAQVLVARCEAYIRVARQTLADLQSSLETKRVQQRQRQDKLRNLVLLDQELEQQQIALATKPKAIIAYNTDLVSQCKLLPADQKLWRDACAAQERRSHNEATMEVGVVGLSWAMRMINNVSSYLFTNRDEQLIEQANTRLQEVITARREQYQSQTREVQQLRIEAVEGQAGIESVETEIKHINHHIEVVQGLQERADSTARERTHQEQRHAILDVMNRLQKEVEEYQASLNTSFKKFQDLLHIGKDKRASERRIAAGLQHDITAITTTLGDDSTAIEKAVKDLEIYLAIVHKRLIGMGEGKLTHILTKSKNQLAQEAALINPESEHHVVPSLRAAAAA